MSFENLPNVLRGHLIDFLLPPDVHALVKACPTYLPFMTRSLNYNLALVLKNGNTKFKCLDPLHSFTSLARSLPTPRSVCIR